MNRHERHLIRQCLAGDAEAFGFLVDQYKEGVYALAFSRLGNAEDAEDIAQEAFLKAYQKLPTLRWWEAFPAWLYAITTNLCRGRLRSRARQPQAMPLEPGTSGYHEAGWNNYQTQQIRLSIQESLHSLPEIHREILCLHYMTGMDGKELSQFLRISPGAVHKRLSRARAMLRELLLKEEALEGIPTGFGSDRLGAGFTLRVLETIRQLHPQPPVPTAWLPWAMAGMGLALMTAITWSLLGTGDWSGRTGRFQATESSDFMLVSVEPAYEKSPANAVADSLRYGSQAATDSAGLTTSGNDFAIGNEDGGIPHEWIIVSEDYSIYDENASNLARNDSGPFIIDGRDREGFAYRKEFVYPIQAPRTGWYLVKIRGRYDGFDALHERYSIDIGAGSQPPVNASRTAYAGPIAKQTGIAPAPDPVAGWQWVNHGRFYLEQGFTYWVHFSPVPDGHSIHFGYGGRIELVEASGLAQVGDAKAHTTARGYFANEVHLLQNPNPMESGSTSMLGPPDGRAVLLNGGRVILGFADGPTEFDWGVDIPPNTGLILANAGIEVEDIHFGSGFAASALSNILTAKLSEAHITHTVVASPAWSTTNPKRDAVLHFYALDANFRSDSSVNINANDDLLVGNLGVDAVFFIPRNMRERKTP